MKRFVREIKEKDHVQTVFLVTEKNPGTDRNGKAFLSLTLADSTGHLNGRMFDKVDAVASSFEIGDVIWVKGFVQLFQNRKQLILHEVRRAVEGEYSMAELVADRGGDANRHYSDVLVGFVDEFSDPFLKRLVLETLNDAKIKDLLLCAPAAKTIHHAYSGSLIEHVHSIAKVMVAL